MILLSQINNNQKKNHNVDVIIPHRLKGIKGRFFFIRLQILGTRLFLTAHSIMLVNHSCHYFNVLLEGFIHLVFNLFHWKQF